MNPILDSESRVCFNGGMDKMSTTPNTGPNSTRTNPTVVLYSYCDDSGEGTFSLAVFPTRAEAMVYAEQGLRELADLIGVASVHPESCNPFHEYIEHPGGGYEWQFSTWTADATEFRPEEVGIQLRCTIRVEPFEMSRTYGEWDCIDARSLAAQPHN